MSEDRYIVSATLRTDPEHKEIPHTRHVVETEAFAERLVIARNKAELRLAGIAAPVYEWGYYPQTGGSR